MVRTLSARILLGFAALTIASPVPLIGYSGLPLPVRALSAIGCGLSVLLGGPFLIAQAMDGRLFRGRERAS